MTFNQSDTGKLTTFFHKIINLTSLIISFRCDNARRQRLKKRPPFTIGLFLTGSDTHNLTKLGQS